MYELAPKDGLSQGDIIAGLSAHGYESTQTFGVVLTARCDFSQRKTDIINYVPAVPLITWYRREGWRILASEEEARLLSQFEAEAATRIRSQQLELAHVRSSLAAYGGIATLDLLRSSGASPEGKIRTFAERVDELRQSQKDGACPAGIAPSQVVGLLKQIQKHSVADLYFFPFDFLGDTEAGCAHVALLRQIYALPMAALRPTQGVAAVELNDSGAAFRPPINSTPQIPFGRVARLLSPYTEHFLQRATMLFARVGVSDVRFRDVNAVAEALR